VCKFGKVCWLPAQRTLDTIAHVGVTPIKDGVAKALLLAQDTDEAAASAWKGRMVAMRDGCRAATPVEPTLPFSKVSFAIPDHYVASLN